VEVETPEIVTVRVERPDGTAWDVLFTRDEFARIEQAAAAEGVDVGRFVVMAAMRSGSAKLGGLA
jgi:hypothetical protein